MSALLQILYQCPPVHISSYFLFNIGIVHHFDMVNHSADRAHADTKHGLWTDGWVRSNCSQDSQQKVSTKLFSLPTSIKSGGVYKLEK